MAFFGSLSVAIKDVSVLIYKYQRINNSYYYPVLKSDNTSIRPGYLVDLNVEEWKKNSKIVGNYRCPLLVLVRNTACFQCFVMITWNLLTGIA